MTQPNIDIDKFTIGLSQLRGLVMAIRGADTIDEGELDGLLTLSNQTLECFEEIEATIDATIDAEKVTPLRRRA